MKVVKPPKLKKNDLIGVVAPASSPDDHTKITAGIEYLEKLGYRVKPGKNIDKVFGYLAGTDEERLEDIHEMFGNKEVKAIFCLRGGYGTPRLLDKINYTLIKRHPKIFVGYSDITALQMAIFKKTGMVTFSGPMIAPDFGVEISPFTEENFWHLITSEKKTGRIKTPEHESLNNITKGKTSGRLIGGNLSVLSALIGTEYFPRLEDNILFIEEVSELPYRIDRMLSQMKLSGFFKKLNGIILGAFVDCYEHDPLKRTLTLGEVIGDYFNELKIPVLYNFQNGHIKDITTIAYGINVKINANDCTVDFTEGAVV
jgi:muramoyltetrapeptide carboxypeptidase